jgi:hypothetical protein
MQMKIELSGTVVTWNCNSPELQLRFVAALARYMKLGFI